MWWACSCYLRRALCKSSKLSSWRLPWQILFRSCTASFHRSSRSYLPRLTRQCRRPWDRIWDIWHRPECCYSNGKVHYPMNRWSRPSKWSWEMWYEVCSLQDCYHIADTMLSKNIIKAISNLELMGIYIKLTLSLLLPSLSSIFRGFSWHLT